MSNKLAVAIYDGLLGFEYGIAAEIFGLNRPGLEVDWYDYLPCRVERGGLKTSHGMRFSPSGDLEDLAEADTILIPGWRDPRESPKASFLEALQHAHQNGARLVSICTGAFVLAYAGLLDEKRATTHWLHVDFLTSRFPTVRVANDSIYVHDGRISSSAGSAAGLDLCLSIVRHDFGIKVANTIARRMVAPVHREGGQSQYAEPNILNSEDDDFGPIMDWMVANLDKPFAVRQVADQFAMSLRTFQRRFQLLTGVSPLRWLSQQRVAKARGLLEATDGSIEQIAVQSGLGTTSNLRKHFSRQLGTTPSAYRSTFRPDKV